MNKSCESTNMEEQWGDFIRSHRSWTTVLNGRAPGVFAPKWLKTITDPDSTGNRSSPFEGFIDTAKGKVLSPNTDVRKAATKSPSSAGEPPHGTAEAEGFQPPEWVARAGGSQPHLGVVIPKRDTLRARSRNTTRRRTRDGPR